MVGYNPHESVHLSPLEYAIAGAVSGSITRSICQPLDVLKIRFQLQVEPIKKQSGSKYSGLAQASWKILKEEGWRAGWKGHKAAQVLSILYAMAQYTSFEVLTKGAWLFLPVEMTTSNWRSVTHTVCGGLSGCVATTVIHPLDVLRTRFIAQGEPKTYANLTDATRKIFAAEGPRGFYRGLSPAIMQIAPQMGLQFGFYSLFVGLWNRSKGAWTVKTPGNLESLICGSVAGVLSKILIYPLDVSKKRLQVQGFEAARRGFGITRSYSGLLACLLQVGREEGLRGLYKGLSPGLLKAAATAGLHFSIYEHVCDTFLLIKVTSSD